MNNREILLKGEAGIRFRIEEGEDCIQITAYQVNPFRNGVIPPIPKGFKLVETMKADFVIKNIKDGSQFIWVPMELDESAPLLETTKEFESIQKNGGLYVSRFNISLGEHGKPVANSSNKPMNAVTFVKAMRVAELMNKMYGDQNYVFIMNEFIYHGFMNYLASSPGDKALRFKFSTQYEWVLPVNYDHICAYITYNFQNPEEIRMIHREVQECDKNTGFRVAMVVME